MGMTFMRERKAISPVIATVILVAVAITVAVGVSYWMSGISSQYTQFEKVEIQTGYATFTAAVPTTSDAFWNVSLSIKNSGSGAATLTHVFVNDIPVSFGDVTAVPGATGVGSIIASVDTDNTLTLDSGVAGEVAVLITQGTGITLTSGTTVNVKLHSAGGMDYIKLIRLP
jgi:flagellin-like protein